jgi:HK97 family phage major capsid protein
MKSKQALLDQRAKVWNEMSALLEGAKDRDLTADERSTYANAEAELDQLTADIELTERHDQRAAKLAAPDRSDLIPGQRTAEHDQDGQRTADTEAAAFYRNAFAGFLRSGMTLLSADEQRALQQGIVQIDDKALRAAGVATGSAGGFTVPAEFRNKIVETMDLFDVMVGLADVVETETGAALPWPTADDTANEGAILGENTQVTEQDLLFGTDELGAYTYTSKLVRASLQFLQDTGIAGVEGYLGTKLGQRLGRIHNRHFTVGTGIGQPQGIVAGAAVGRTGAAGQVASVTYDDLIRLEHSVDPAYRNGGNLRYMFTDTTLASLRLIKDADGRPLWQPSYTEGAPDNFNGRRYVVNPYMPEMAASAKSVLFGDFKAAYLIRRVKGIQLLRLSERYADFLQVGFLAFDRHDGKVVDGNAVKAYQNAAV